MAIALIRAGLLRNPADVGWVCLRCALKQRGAARSPAKLSTRLPLLSGVRSASTATSQPARVSDGDSNAEHSPVGQDPTGNIAPEHVRLKVEFETNRKIRDYLRGWAELNPNPLDPVHAPNGTETNMGLMFNGINDQESAWAFSQSETESDMNTPGQFENEYLEPGDLVGRVAADGMFYLAIYVQSVCKQNQFYTDGGNWRVCKQREVDYVVKGFAAPELLTPIKPYFPTTEAKPSSSIQSVPEGGLPRSLGAPLVRLMTNFRSHMVEFYRMHAKALDHLHEHVADEEQFLHLTLEELTMKVLDLEESELNSVNLFTIHQAVRRHPFLIEKDTTSWFSRKYLVQPKRIARVFERVTQWVHEHQKFCIQNVISKAIPELKDHPIQRFIRKAQRLIRLSRKVRSPTIMASVGPTSKKFPPGQDGNPMVYREVLTENFTDTDRTIIEYLQLFATPGVEMTSGTLRSTGSHIMRATGMYNTLGVSEHSARLFLQELGVIAPWENLGLLDQTLLLPGHGMSPRDDAEWEGIEKSCTDLGPDRLEDSMHSLRKDWGDLPVYCVDDANAQEIDDGVSLERIPGSDDTFWVRVHVANPTAFFKHDDPIVKYAGTRLSTTYVPDRTYPILPPALTQDHFSLASGRPTLTFSAKINLQGEILDTEVVNGKIQKVISITHDTLREFFDPTLNQDADFLTVGGEFVSSPPAANRNIQESLSSKDQDTFRILRQLMLAYRQQRKKNGAMDMVPSIKASVSVQAGTVPMKPYHIDIREGRQYIGDPIIRLRRQPIDPYEIPDQSKTYLISLIMNLAGDVAGRFCASRNLPVVYDGTWYEPEYNPVTSENIADFSGENFFHLVMPKAIPSPTPIHHHMLGLDAYVKSTSPLRRFTDIIAHYQIEAALRFEREHGRQFDASTDVPEESTSTETTDSSSPLLPYSHEDLEYYILHTRALRLRLRTIQTFSVQHWACMLLFRAFYFAECALTPTFSVLLRSPRRGPAREGTVYAGMITDLGIECSISIPEDCPDRDRMNVFGVVDAKITAIDMATLNVSMVATGFVKAFERTGEWA